MNAEEYRVFGPPGTGKTTYLSEQIGEAASKWGGKNIVVSSFTKTAAAELVHRKLPIPESSVGTLHSLCYRALGCPPVAAGNAVKDFNEAHPDFALSGEVDGDIDDMGAEGIVGRGGGDSLRIRADNLKARRIRKEAWPSNVAAFDAAWTKWKESNGMVDFTDMIEFALRDDVNPPENAQIGFFDEVQDFTPLELSLIRKWATKMRRVVLVGDDDQCLYRFKGATPDAFLHPQIRDDHKMVLERSHRVPAAVHAVAEAWVGKIKTREPKRYMPRDAAGSVEYANGSYKSAGLLLNHAEQALADGKSVMFLAACSYMLDPLKAELRKRAIPFWNPYRLRRGDWNPLSRGTAKRTTAVDRLLAFTSSKWTNHDVYLWSTWLRSKGVLVRGGKEWLEALKGEDDTLNVRGILSQFTEEEAALVEQLSFGNQAELTKSILWLLDRLLDDNRRKMEFAAKVMMAHGRNLLEKKPQVIIGTIHSVKGGQADVCYLLPDLSLSGMSEWTGDADEQDSVRRCFYVGMTRAREKLVLCRPSGRACVTWN